MPEWMPKSAVAIAEDEWKPKSAVPVQEPEESPEYMPQSATPIEPEPPGQSQVITPAELGQSFPEVTTLEHAQKVAAGWEGGRQKAAPLGEPTPIRAPIESAVLMGEKFLRGEPGSFERANQAALADQTATQRPPAPREPAKRFGPFGLSTESLPSASIRAPRSGFVADVAEAMKGGPTFNLEGYQTPEQREREKQLANELVPRLEWYAEYGATLGGLMDVTKYESMTPVSLGPGAFGGGYIATTKPKEKRGPSESELLKQRAEEFTGFGPALMPLAGELGKTAVEWAAFWPALFKGWGMADDAIREIPQVKRAIEAVGGAVEASKIAKAHPYLTQVAKEAVSKFPAGVATGATAAGIEDALQEQPLTKTLRDMAEQGMEMGAITSAFGAASAGDKALWLQGYSKALSRSAYNRIQRDASRLRSEGLAGADRQRLEALGAVTGSGTEAATQVARTQAQYEQAIRNVDAAVTRRISDTGERALREIDLTMKQLSARVFGRPVQKMYGENIKEFGDPAKAAEYYLKYGKLPPSLEAKLPSVEREPELSTGQGVQYETRRVWTDRPVPDERIIETRTRPDGTNEYLVEVQREVAPTTERLFAPKGLKRAEAARREAVEARIRQSQQAQPERPTTEQPAPTEAPSAPTGSVPQGRPTQEAAGAVPGAGFLSRDEVNQLKALGHKLPDILKMDPAEARRILAEPEAQRGQPIPATAETVAAPSAVKEAVVAPERGEPIPAGPEPADLDGRGGEVAEGAGKQPQVGEKIVARPGHVYRAGDRADDFIGMEDRSYSSGLQWYEGTGFLVEYSGESVATEAATNPDAFRGDMSGRKVTRVYYEPEAYIPEAEPRFMAELQKLREQFPDAQFVRLKTIENPETGDFERFVADAALAKAGEAVPQPASPAQAPTGVSTPEGQKEAAATATPAIPQEWQILNNRGQRTWGKTFATKDEAQKFLEKKITSSVARTQFAIEKVEATATPIQPPYLMTRYEYVQAKIDSTPKKDLRGLGLNELVLKSNDEHKAVVQQALSRGDLAPQDAVAIHKELYPDIETWKEYKEAAARAEQPAAVGQIVPPAAPGATWGDSVKKGNRVTVLAKTTLKGQPQRVSGTVVQTTKNTASIRTAEGKVVRVFREGGMVEEAREQAAPGGVHPNALKAIRDAIAAKDGATLVKWLHLGNKSLRQVFTAETGVKLPNTEKGTNKAILDWASPNRVVIEGISSPRIEWQDFVGRLTEAEKEKVKSFIAPASPSWPTTHSDVEAQKELIRRELYGEGKAPVPKGEEAVEETRPKAVKPTTPEAPAGELPIEKARRELARTGQTRIGDDLYWIENGGATTGWSYSVPSEPGSDERMTVSGREGQRWTGKQAIEALMEFAKTRLDVMAREAERTEVAEKPKAMPKAPKPKTAWGERNKVVTKTEYDDIKTRLAAKFGKLPGGREAGGTVMFDAEMWSDMVKLGLYHFEAGARAFADWSGHMVSDIGEGISPHLNGIWAEVEARGKDMPKAEIEEETVDTSQPEVVESEKEVEYERQSEQQGVGTRRHRPGGIETPAEVPAETVPPSPEQGAGATVRPQRPAAGGEISGEGRRGGQVARGDAGSDTGDVGQPAGRRPTPRRPSDSSGQLDYRITDADNIEAGGQKTKYRNNVAAIRLLKTIESEGRKATAEEQAALVRYTGWGGMPQAFNSWDNDWRKEYEELRELLSDEEYNAARASTPNAHYTSPDVVRGIWEGLHRLGFKGGRINEPAIGTGMFYGLMPDDIAATSRLFGVELDNISARIAKQLYQSASIENNGFQDVRYPDGFFDLFVSNVPFDEQTRPTDPDMRNVNFALHDFYFAKALKKTRPGGLVAFIASKGTMDKGNPVVRKYLAKQADLIGAIRLPKTAFGKIANTEVVTDIIILQKRTPGQDAKGETWAEIGELAQGKEAFSVNEYFVRHPEHILGKLSYEGTMYRGNEMTVESTGIDLRSRISELLGQFAPTQDIHAAQNERAAEMRKPEYQKIAPENVKEMAYVMQGGNVFQKVNGFMVPVSVGATVKPRMAGMIRVRDAARKLIGLQIDPNAEGAAVERARKEMGKAYDAFVAKYEPLHTPANRKLFFEDPDVPLLLALENWDNDTKKATKAKIFTERTQFPVKAIEKADSPQDAVAISMSEHGRVDVDYIGKLLGLEPEGVAKEIAGYAFENPEAGQWEPAFLYLSGNVRKKLAAAEAAAKLDPKYQVNADALRAVQPEDVAPTDISVRLGSPWIDPDTYLEFLRHLAGRDYGVKFTKLEHDGSWIISGNATSGSWDTPDFTTADFVIKTMNYKDATVWRKDDEGKRYVDKEATTIARVMQQKIKDEFERWIWADTNRARRLARVYNDLFNHTIFPQWDGSYLQFPGQSSTPLQGGRLRPHQANAVARFLMGGNMLMAHAVGAGKTYAGIAMAMEGRRIGQVKKAIFVVPNHKIDDWRVDWMKLYPSANILAATRDDFTPQKRQILMNRITTGDWDGIIVPMSSFEKIPMSPERVRSFFQEQIDELEMEIRAMQVERGRENKNIVKRLEKAKSALQEKLKKQEATWKKDRGPYFDELGIDMMLVDESHAFKNLFFVTKMDRVSGLQVSQTQRSFDMYMKTKHLNETTRHRGIVYATGTPITNTIGEMFTLQRYLQPQTLKEAGLQAFDFWAKTFGDTVTDVEVDPTGGGFRVNTRFARFTNLPELMQMFRSVTDIITKKTMNIPLPKLKGGKPITVQTDPSPDVVEYIQGLVERAEDIRAGHVKPWEDNMLAVTNDGRHVALDPRLRIKGAADAPNSKINRVVEEVHRIYKESAKDKALQVIWCDLSTPKKGQWSVYDDIKSKLIAKGIKREEIAFIHDAADEKQQASLYLKANAGKIRVLLASTGKMGTGANVQQRLIAAHHLTAPWVPAEVEQRDGRIERQGNMFDEIQVYQYVTKGTFDAYMWQTLETKAKFIEQVMNGETTGREVEDISKNSLTYAEVKALASGNPKIIEAIRLDAAVKALQAEERAHRADQFRIAEEKGSTLPQKIKNGEDLVGYLKEDNDKATAAIQAAGEGTDITVAGTRYAKRKDAAEALSDHLGKLNKLSEEPIEIGSAYGFAADVKWYKDLGKLSSAQGKVKTREELDALSGQYGYWRLRLHGSKLTYDVELGDSASGNITRIENAVALMEDRYKQQVAILGRDKRRMEELAQIADKPFPKADELTAKRAKLTQLQNEIGLDKKHDQSQSIIAEDAPPEAAGGEAEDVGDEGEGEEGPSRPSAFRPGFAGIGAPAGMAGANVPPVVIDQQDMRESLPPVEAKKYPKDIGPVAKWVNTLSNAARNTRNPQIVRIAEDLVDTPLVMREQLQRLLIESESQYKKLPKEYRANRGEKFMQLMDEYHSPEEIDASSGIPDAVKPALKWFKKADEDVRQFIIRHKREMMKAVHLHQETEKLVELGVENGLKWEARERMIGGLKTTSVYDLDADTFLNKEKAADALAKAEIKDNWGRQWEHIQHIFFGQYNLKVVRETVDDEGKPQTEEQFIGTAETQAEAADKLLTWAEAAREDGEDLTGVKLTFDRDFHMPYDMTRLPTKQVQALKRSLQEALEAERREVDEGMRGIVGTKAAKQKFWGALLQRKGAAGYSTDFMRVWQASMSQYMRWKHLSAMNGRVTPTIEALRSGGLPGWANDLEWWRDNLMGRKRSDTAVWLDDRLARIPGIGLYVKPYFLERWSGRIKSLNYLRHLQTVRFYVVNSLQIVQTLWPVVGERGFYRAVKLYYSPEGKAILDKYGVATEGKFKESGVVSAKKTKGWSPAAMSERRNQGVAFLALYEHGRSMGMSETEAARYGRLRGQVFTQFAHSPADVPRFMAGNLTGLIFQYKRFTVKNLELVSRLLREGNYGGAARWLTALVSIGGFSVFLRILTGLPMAGYLTYKGYQWIKKHLGQNAADIFHHGLPALIGIDVSGSVTPIDVPYGRTTGEKIGNVVLGPTGQTIQRLYGDLTNTDVAKDEGLARRTLRSIFDSSPTLKQFESLVKALQKDTSNLDAKGREAYKLEVWDLWKKSLGFVPEAQSQQRMQMEAMLSLKETYDKHLDNVALARIAGDNKKAAQLIVQWNGMFPEAPMTAKDTDNRVKGRGKAAEQTKAERTFQGLSTKLKGAFPEGWKNVSSAELRKMRDDNTYQDDVKGTAANGYDYHSYGDAHKGKEDLVRQIKQELRRRREEK